MGSPHALKNKGKGLLLSLFKEQKQKKNSCNCLASLRFPLTQISPILSTWSIKALAGAGVSQILGIALSALLGPCLTVDKWLFFSSSFTLAPPDLSELLLLVFSGLREEQSSRKLSRGKVAFKRVISAFVSAK